MIRYFNIIISNKSRNTDKAYCYKTNSSSCEDILTGRRVLVNFNNSLIVGIVVSEEDSADIDPGKVKEIISVIDEKPIVDSDKIILAKWIRETYLSRFNEAFSLMNPPMSKIEVCINKSCKSDFEMDTLPVGKWISLKKLTDILKDRKTFEILNTSFENRLVIIESRDKSFEKKVTETVHLVKEDFEDHVRKNSHKQLRILSALRDSPVEIRNLIKITGSTRSEIVKLCKKGFVDISTSISAESSAAKVVNRGDVTINDRQRDTVESILNSNVKRHLIHGVTGSGKTEVYMKIIENIIEEEKSVVYLIPEISLTPQTIERFKRRFGDRIAIIHSRLTSKKRMDEWLKIYNGECDIVIGPRSALFTPVRNLGAVIIDESHEDSYKSSSSPKYDTIEVCEKLTEIGGIKLVLGTATPLAGIYLKAIRNEYALHSMPERISRAQMPKIKVVDMRNELSSGNAGVFSTDLKEALISAYGRNEQSILFLNRRGYSSFVSCRNCGYVVKCDNCDVSMTYHSMKGYLICHYCGSAKKIDHNCPQCGSTYFKSFGIGTERIEEEVKKLIPEARVKRMDFDTVNNIEDYNGVYNDFRDRKIDILVGTQMLAKGLHFPHVTVVGVVSADLTINLPFFNSNEKSYQLLTQVSGRAGRGDKDGNVFIQTYDPENYSIVDSKNNDYLSFVKKELYLRKEFRYPPYIEIMTITVSSIYEDKLKLFVDKKYTELKETMAGLISGRKMLLYRPMNSNIYRIKKKYRISITMKYKKNDAEVIKNNLRKILLNKSYKDMEISLDLNPTFI